MCACLCKCHHNNDTKWLKRGCIPDNAKLANRIPKGNQSQCHKLESDDQFERLFDVQTKVFGYLRKINILLMSTRLNKNSQYYMHIGN